MTTTTRPASSGVAIHTALWVDRWGEDLAPHVERAAALGFDGAEVSLLGLDESSAAALRAVADGCGVALRCTTGLSVAEDVTSADPAVRAHGLDVLRRGADIAAAVGADVLTGVTYAPWGAGSSVDRSGRWARCVEALAEVAPRFAARGIVLGVEAVNRFETDMVCTAAEAVALALAVDSPAVGVHLDTFHMNVEERSVPAAVALAAPHLVHVHVVDNDRGAPGRGHIDWPPFFAALATAGYDGWIGLELFVRSDAPVSADLRIWRPIEDDPTEAAAAGLAFVRAGLATAAA